MKKLLATTAIVAGAMFFQPSAYAGNIIDVTSYSLPDAASFNSVTTNGYSYYTGPVVFNLSDGTSVTVYCVDLTHELQIPGMYQYSILTNDGNGHTINETESNLLGNMAALGIANYASNPNFGAAVQAAIWDSEYTTNSTTGVSAISTDIFNVLHDHFANNGDYAVSLVPLDGWPNVGASQQMITGQLIDAPEPASLSILGLGLLGTLAFRKRR